MFLRPRSPDEDSTGSKFAESFSKKGPRITASILAELLVFAAPHHASSTVQAQQTFLATSNCFCMCFCTSAVFSSEGHVHFVTPRLAMAFPGHLGATVFPPYTSPHPTLAYTVKPWKCNKKKHTHKNSSK